MGGQDLSPHFKACIQGFTEVALLAMVRKDGVVSDQGYLCPQSPEVHQMCLVSIVCGTDVYLLDQKISMPILAIILFIAELKSV